MPHRKPPPLDLAALLPSWELALRAEHKSPQTVKSYGDSIRGFIRWCDENGHAPDIDRELVKGFVAALLANGAEPATARARQLGIRRFTAWLEEEREIDSDPLLGLRPPKLDTKMTASLTDDQLRNLIKVCSSGKDFRDRRDEAIVRLMAETGLRTSKTVALTVADVQPLKNGAVAVRPARA
jgi:site-specific recombinase XerD